MRDGLFTSEGKVSADSLFQLHTEAAEYSQISRSRVESRQEKTLTHTTHTHTIPRFRHREYVSYFRTTCPVAASYWTRLLGVA